MAVFPFVTALIVARNEEVYIERAMMSLVNQTYPKERYEIVVIDGESTDNTVEIIRTIIRKYRTPTFDIRIMNNPNHSLASGWNIGIQNSKGEYTVRIDAHAEAAESFIEKSVETILKVHDAICVGGKLLTKSLEGDNDVISKVLSSPFGVGNSSFRVSETAGYADTAVYGLYKKDVFRRVGYFNEQYIRNQDIELHSRIRAIGGKFYFNPVIQCIYYSRNTVKKMIKQAFGNGKWNMVLIKNHSSAVRLRHLVPFVFVLFLIITLFGGFVKSFLWWAGMGVVALHLVMGLIAGINKTHTVSEIIKMPFLFFLLHVSYGTGYLVGLFTKLEE